MADFQNIVKTYKDRVYNTCLGMIRNTEDAQDLSQEVFIEIYQQLAGFRKESSLKTWIYRITVYKCLQHMRRQKTQKRSGNLVALDDHANSAVGFDHPGVKLENKELARILFAAIAMLPENQQTAFTLHKVENLTHEEIASIMKKSVSAVESLIHRAKQMLKEKLKTFYEKV